MKVVLIYFAIGAVVAMIFEIIENQTRKMYQQMGFPLDIKPKKKNVPYIIRELLLWPIGIIAFIAGYFKGLKG